MVDPTPLRRPINWKNLRADEAERVIHERAADSSKVIIIGHPEERSDEREINDVEIFRVLREGVVVDPPRLEGDDWVAVIRRRIRGTRDAGVVTIILRDDKLIVKTVMWVDQ
jgi:hypothetical protein